MLVGVMNMWFHNVWWTCNMWSCDDDDVITCNEYIITCYDRMDVMNGNMLECEWCDVMVFDN